MSVRHSKRHSVVSPIPTHDLNCIQHSKTEKENFISLN
jgi:hypothetical protein